MKTFFKILCLAVFTISIYSCSLLSAAGLSKQGQPVKKAPDDLGKVNIPKSEIKIDHSVWDALLKKHVTNDGMVDYEGFKNDRSQLNNYLKTQRQIQNCLLIQLTEKHYETPKLHHLKP